MDFFFLFAILSLSYHLPLSQCQPSAAPPPAADLCNGIFLTYTLTAKTKIHPFLSPAAQPFSFAATAALLNSDSVPLVAWSLHVGFPNRTLLVSASNAVLSDGSSFPSTVGTAGASFSGFPATDLKTPIQTANDLTQIQAQVNIVGTMFGGVPLPSALSLDNPGYICPRTAAQGNTTISTCCTRDPKFKPNDTAVNGADQFLPRRDGDLTISYDVIQVSTPGTDYLALVTINNRNPLGRLDNWNLSWEWMRGEFINSMKGAYPSVIDTSDCIFGKQGQFYEAFDFSKALNCAKTPTIVDLPLSKANDTNLGLIPFCCRNGTILPSTIDPSESASAFQVQVYKMPPDLNRTVLFPPQNWQIKGSALNPEYKCGPPRRVSPTLFPDPSGLPTPTSAIASWQVVCNISQPKGSKPQCCVSFSAFYNESVIPCKTCACGCPANVGRTCNATAPALLLPSEALLVPFDNRTALAKAWGDLKHFNVPNPMPCGDYCGVSINWHVYTDYTNGWSARVTLFNWDEINFVDWFAAVQLDKAYSGYEAMYSFNGTAIGNDTILMQGLPGLNYLVAEVPGANLASDPRVPGKQQSVISFSKTATPGINVVGGDGFPTKVLFNGEECSLPDTIPMSKGHRSVAAGSFTSLIILLFVSVVILLVEQ